SGGYITLLALKECLGLLEVSGVKALRKPAMDEQQQGAQGSWPSTPVQDISQLVLSHSSATSDRRRIMGRLSMSWHTLHHDRRWKRPCRRDLPPIACKQP